MNTPNSVPCKAQYGKHIRRFRVPATVTYQQLVSHVRKLFCKENLPEHFLLKYKDDEDDWVTFESNEELTEGLQVVQISTTIFRLKIEAGKAQKGLKIAVPEAHPDDVELLLNQLVSDTTQFVSNINSLGKSTYYKVKEHINKLDKKETEQKLQQAVGSIKSTIKNVITDVQTTFNPTNTPLLPTPPQPQYYAPVQPEEEWTLEIDPDSGFQIYEGAPKNIESTTNTPTYHTTVQVPTESISAVVDALIADEIKTGTIEEEVPCEIKEKENDKGKGKIVVSSLPEYEEVDIIVNAPSAKFVHDVNIPDGSKVKPSETLTKVWKLRNAGTSAWPSDVSVVFVGGDEAFSKPHAVKVLPAGPKQEVDVEITLTTPAFAGRYMSFWRLAYKNGQIQFGPKFWIEVMVTGNNTNNNNNNSNSVATKSVQIIEEHPQYIYADQMALLSDMGFCDVDLCAKLLDKFNGDVTQTVTEYLQLSNN